VLLAHSNGVLLCIAGVWFRFGAACRDFGAILSDRSGQGITSVADATWAGNAMAEVVKTAGTNAAVIPLFTV